MIVDEPLLIEFVAAGAACLDGRSLSISSRERLRKGTAHGGLCSVKSSGVLFLLASVSFLAAQPPVAPEPTTTASKVSADWGMDKRTSSNLLRQICSRSGRWLVAYCFQKVGGEGAVECG